MEKIEHDPRIRATHIAVYMALYQQWVLGNKPVFIGIKSKQLMPQAKVSSSATWRNAIRALDEYGYIRYQPNFNRMSCSKVMILDFSSAPSLRNI
ncbi:hypothetical protein N824_16560 [Pedobacter sp. V48]|nr:hypothetical protein N824_16560 [Pedobacter sp. V48]